LIESSIDFDIASQRCGLAVEVVYPLRSDGAPAGCRNGRRDLAGCHRLVSRDLPRLKAMVARKGGPKQYPLKKDLQQNSKYLYKKVYICVSSEGGNLLSSLFLFLKECR